MPIKFLTINSLARFHLVAGLVISMSCQAWALSLGAVQGHAVIGQPVSLQVPVETTRESALKTDCFKISWPADRTRNDSYVLRQGKLELLGGPGNYILKIRGPTVREPIVSFAIAETCEGGLVRDYVIFADPPAAGEAAVSQRIEPPVAGAAQPKTETLLNMSRQRYPLQPKARVKYIKMMLEANPQLTDRDQAIPADMQLVIPEGLPIKRSAANAAEAAPMASNKGQSAEKTAMPSVPAAAKPKTIASDRLKIGMDAMPSSLDAQIVDELVRMIPLIREQNQYQDALIRKLARMEADYQELQQRFLAIESQVSQLKSLPPAPQPPPPPQENVLAELMIAALIGGLVTGLFILLAQGMIAHRKAAGREEGLSLLTTGIPDAAVPAATQVAASITPPAIDVPNVVAQSMVAPAEASAGEEGDRHPFDFDLGALPSNSPPGSGESHGLDFSETHTISTR